MKADPKSDRRRFISAVAGGLLTTLLPARAGGEQAAKALSRVALVFIGSPVADMAGADPVNRTARAFVHGLRDLGWTEGSDIIIERRSAEGRLERIPVLMRELVASKVDVIVTTAPEQASRATQSIPVVALYDNPVDDALAKNLARPERNITGVRSEADPAINGKRMQLLKEVAPNASRFAFLSDSPVSGRPPLWTPETAASARALGLKITLVAVDNVEQFERAFVVLTRDRPDGLLVADTSVNYNHPRIVADFAAKQKIPALYYRREFVDAGGLMSYGRDFADQMRRAAALVDKILKGAKPGDLPFELSTKLELVINLKTAKALGSTIPQSLLVRADEVI